MHRILSLEASRCASTSDEVVSKRFCCSLSLAISFLALVAGFLLGRNATERAFMSRRCHIRPFEHSSYHNSLNNVSFTLKNTDRYLKSARMENLDLEELHDKLSCRNLSNIAKLEALRANFTEETSRIVRSYLVSLNDCFLNLNDYLNITSGYNVTLNELNN